MTEAELNTIIALPNAAIIAPAGHGKTEMIAEIVKHSARKLLLLTHTNAGVDAITKRLTKKAISKTKYEVSTIAAFCMKWCLSYTNTAHFDKTITPFGKQTKQYYSQLYTGTKCIFQNQWPCSILHASYGGIVIDEYQDCIQEQHEIFVALNQYLPIIVLGDPMQGIFSFAGKLVNWSALPFSIINVETYPWRWEHSNKELGGYLNDLRSQLLPILKNIPCTIQIDINKECVEIISPDKFNRQNCYKLLPALQRYRNIVFITKWPNKQLDFCSWMPGIFQFDEKQDCDELYEYAHIFDDSQNENLLLDVMNFVQCCTTGVSTNLSIYKKKLENKDFDFHRIKNNVEFGKILQKAIGMKKEEAILELLKWFNCNKSIYKQYRLELLSEMTRSVKYAIEKNIPIYEAATHIRREGSLQKRYSNFKFLSSRTLLSKGLEFDCVIIDMTDQLSAKDFYVAMTRAMKKIYIISDTTTFTFNK